MSRLEASDFYMLARGCFLFLFLEAISIILPFSIIDWVIKYVLADTKITEHGKR